MENVRISFEIPNSGGFSVKELTDRARHFVMELVAPNEKEPSDEELAEAIASALPHCTDEELCAELDRRWSHYLQHPESAIPHEKIYDTVMSRL